MAQYLFEPCTDLALWDEFVHESPQGSVFSTSDFIKSTGFECSYFFVRKGDDILAATHIFEDGNGKAINNIPFIQYKNCIMFRASDQKNNSKRITEEFKSTELIINEVLKRYNKYEVIHSPYLNDIRPFLWYNYHEPELGKFSNEINYTGIINLEPSVEEIIANCRRDRRRDFRHEIDKYRIEEVEDIELLNQLHDLTFKRQGIERTKEQIQLLRNITKIAIDKGHGRLSVCYFEDKLAAASFLLFDTKKSYHLFGANNPDCRNSKSYSKIISENILFSKSKGLKEFDFVGVNSPQRGDFKISFNTEIISYFSNTVEVKIQDI